MSASGFQQPTTGGLVQMDRDVTPVTVLTSGPSDTFTYYNFDPTISIPVSESEGDCGYEVKEVPVSNPYAVETCMREEQPNAMPKLVCESEVRQQTQLKYQKAQCTGRALATVNGILKEVQCPNNGQSCRVHLRPDGTLKHFAPPTGDQTSMTIPFSTTMIGNGSSTLRNAQVYTNSKTGLIDAAVKAGGRSSSSRAASSSSSRRGGAREMPTTTRRREKTKMGGATSSAAVSRALSSTAAYQAALAEALADNSRTGSFSVGNAATDLGANLLSIPAQSRLRRIKLGSQTMSAMTYDGESNVLANVFADGSYHFSVRDVPGGLLTSLPKGTYGQVMSAQVMSKYLDYYNVLLSVRALLAQRFSQVLQLHVNLGIDSIAIVEADIMQAFATLTQNNVAYNVGSLLASALEPYADMRLTVNSAVEFTFEDGRPTPIGTVMYQFAFGRFQSTQQFIGLIPLKYWTASDFEQKAFALIAQAWRPFLVDFQSASQKAAPSSIVNALGYPIDLTSSSVAPMSAALIESYFLNLFATMAVKFGARPSATSIASISGFKDITLLSTRAKEFVAWAVASAAATAASTGTTTTATAQYDRSLGMTQLIPNEESYIVPNPTSATAAADSTTQLLPAQYQQYAPPNNVVQRVRIRTS